MVPHVRLLLKHLATNAAFMAPFQPVHKTLVPGQLQGLDKLTATQEAAVNARPRRLCWILLSGGGLWGLWLSSLCRGWLRNANSRFLWQNWCWGQRDASCPMGTPVIEELGKVDKGLPAGTRMQRIWSMGSPVGQEKGFCAVGQATVYT